MGPLSPDIQDRVCVPPTLCETAREAGRWLSQKGATKIILLPLARGEVGESHICGVDFVHEFAVGLGFFFDAFPLGIVLERFPIGGRGFAAGMVEDVDQSVALVGLIERQPVGDAFHAMLVENLYRVIAKAGQQVGQFSWGGVIDAEFEDSGRVLGGSSVTWLRSGPQRCREECGRGN